MSAATLELLAEARARQEEIVAFLRELVECESPSDSPEAVNRFLDLLGARTSDIASAKRWPCRKFGGMLRLDFHLPGPARKRGRILGVGHADTVWPLGTLRSMPWRRSDGRISGPGVFDMKAGLAFFVFAARILRELEVPVPNRVSLWVVPDEEVGSEESRPRTEWEARRSDAVLVLEPGAGLEGKAKTARKGVGDYLLTVRGRASHAGVDFAAGASAVLELARQLERIASFTGLRPGLTVNPGVVRGGTRSNVVAAEAIAEIDLRVARLRDFPVLEKRFKSLKTFDKRCTLELAGGLNRPPMERTKGGVALFRQARRFAAQMGVNLEESSTGGGSDGNFTAALGIPTLDGIGAVGEGAHAPHECILENRIADRTALLAALLSGLSKDS
jgi:glutamate carboxypeptidase